MLAACYHFLPFSARSSAIRFCSRNHFLMWTMDSWNVTGFASVFFCSGGMRKIRRAPSSRKTEVCTSIAAMPVKTYRLRPWKRKNELVKPRGRRWAHLQMGIDPLVG